MPSPIATGSISTSPRAGRRGRRAGAAERASRAPVALDVTRRRALGAVARDGAGAGGRGDASVDLTLAADARALYAGGHARAVRSYLTGKLQRLTAPRVAGQRRGDACGPAARRRAVAALGGAGGRHDGGDRSGGERLSQRADHGAAAAPRRAVPEHDAGATSSCARSSTARSRPPRFDYRHRRAPRFAFDKTGFEDGACGRRGAAVDQRR